MPPQGLEDSGHGERWPGSLAAIAAWWRALLQRRPDEPSPSTQLAERQRDEALRFFSHDARTSASRILGLIELARLHDEPATGRHPVLLEQIEQEARAGLARSDRFVQRLRAESRALRAESLDLRALLQMAVDAAWSQARARQLQLMLLTSLDEAPCVADRSMLSSAFDELLSHAIAHSPPGGQIRCELHAGDARDWHVSVSAGDEPAHPAPFKSPEPPQPSELPLLRTTLRRHGGDIDVDRGSSAGCLVRLRLPADPAAAAAIEE